MEKTTVFQDYNDTEKNSGNSPAFPAINLMANKKEMETLSKEEEQKLMARIKNAEARLNAYKKAGAPNKLISQAENEYIELRNEFIMHNLKLVASITISTIRRFGLYDETHDMFSSGCEGLIKAIKKFDPDNFGNKFSTYATEWIMSYMQRSLQNESKVVRMPVHVQEGIRAAKKISNNFEKLHSRAPSSKEIAKEMKINQKQLKALMNKEISTISFNDVIAGTDVEYEERIFSPGISPQTLAEAADSAEKSIKNLDKIFNEMKTQESFILKKRTGYLNEEPEILIGVGKDIGLSKERVRQIQVIALENFQLTAKKLIESGDIKDDPVLEKITETDKGNFKIPPIKILDILKSLKEIIQNQIETYHAVT